MCSPAAAALSILSWVIWQRQQQPWCPFLAMLLATNPECSRVTTAVPPVQIHFLFLTLQLPEGLCWQPPNRLISSSCDPKLCSYHPTFVIQIFILIFLRENTQNRHICLTLYIFHFNLEKKKFLELWGELINLLRSISNRSWCCITTDEDSNSSSLSRSTSDGAELSTLFFR